MNILRTVTVIKWKLADNSTGFQYTVRYSPANGVDEIISVYAVEKASTNRIDVTLSMIHDHRLESTIEVLLKDELAEAYYNQKKPVTALFRLGASLMINIAR